MSQHLICKLTIGASYNAQCAMQARCLVLRWRLWNLSLEIRAELRDNKQNACDAVNSPSIINNEQLMMEQDELHEPAQQNQASPAFSFADWFAAQPAASPALNPPVVCNGNGQHMGELADDLQVTASPAAAWLRNGWAASPAAIPATADNTSACALDDTGSVLSFAQQSARAPNDNGSVFNLAQQSARAPNDNGSVFNLAQQSARAPNDNGSVFSFGQQSARAPNDNGSVFSFGQQNARAPSDSGSHNNFAQQGSPAQYLCLVSFLKKGTMAASPLRARTPTMVPARPPPPPLADQSAQSQ
jgi:hypothetical protein